MKRKISFKKTRLGVKALRSGRLGQLETWRFIKTTFGKKAKERFIKIRREKVMEAFLKEHKNLIMALMGRKGGLAGRGKCKARTRKQAQKAARARWRKRSKKGG